MTLGALFSRARLMTLAAAALGALLFWIAGLPLPLLLGSMFGCLAAALAGVRLQGVGWVGFSMRAVLGVAAGASITPALLGQMGGMAISLALVPVFVLIIGLIGYPLFRKVYGFDPPTAYYAAMPGGLQDMLLFGQEAGANVRTLSLIHATRLLVIVSLAPMLLNAIYGLSFDAPPGRPAAEVPPLDYGLMVLAAAGGWAAAQAVGMFGAAILGPLIATAALSLSGLLTQRPPAEAIIAAQFIIGLSIGASYTGVTWPELRRDVAAGGLYCLALAAITFVFAETVALSGLADPMNAFLAFSPGGQGEMILLALIASADLPYVVAHHVARVLLVIGCAPLFARWMPDHSPRV